MSERNDYKLGGRVLVPPFDIPRFRQAVLADPQGAMFSVAQLKRTGEPAIEQFASVRTYVRA